VLIQQGYRFYDSKRAVSAHELQRLYRFTSWGKGRSIDQIKKMLEETSLCFSVYHEGSLVAFCRIITDFVFRGSLWDIMVHPDHQGKGVGSALIDYALEHPAVKDIPLILTYTTELGGFLDQYGFKQEGNTLMLLRCPLEFS